MNTDKPNQTASAPETRTGFDYWHPKSKAFDPDPDKRTIPAEKPTDDVPDDGPDGFELPGQELPEINWVAIAESNAKALEQAQAHAAKLAEALREIASDFESRKTYRPDNQIDSALNTLRQNARIARLALSAYESEVQP